MSAVHADSSGGRIRTTAFLLFKLKSILMKRATNGLRMFAAVFHETRRLEAARVIERYRHLIQEPAPNDLAGEKPSGSQPRSSP